MADIEKHESLAEEETVDTAETAVETEPSVTGFACEYMYDDSAISVGITSIATTMARVMILFFIFIHLSG